MLKPRSAPVFTHSESMFQASPETILRPVQGISPGGTSSKLVPIGIVVSIDRYFALIRGYHQAGLKNHGFPILLNENGSTGFL